MTTPSLAQWQPVPLMTAAQKAQVKIGSEGAQWGRAITLSRDGQFALWGTDVGGLFRSLDGGKTWEPCNVGYSPRGTAGLAIDPGNLLRVLSVGANSNVSDMHGLWLSEDGAASWKQTFKAEISGSHDSREQLAFAPSTYNTARQRTDVVYWSRIADDKPMWGTVTSHPALYKSTDGGLIWAEVPNTAAIGGSILKVKPTGKIIYAANPGGAFRSQDGGATWMKTLDGEVTGLDVSRNAANNVWATKADGVYLSTNSGASWSKIAGSAALVQADSPLRDVHVAPSNARNLVLWREGPNWNWVRFYSQDGGATWKQSSLDTSLSFLPTNSRQGLFAWNPSNASVLLCAGGDYPTRSTDGGAVYKWTGDGVNNILAGAMQFNAQNPELMFVSSQDYNGASTADGGKTWEYQNPSGNGWGGFTYGGYAASSQVMVVGNADGWGGTRELTVTRDGGTTWTKTGLNFSGPDVSVGAPDDARVIFASNLRSADGALTWSAMSAATNSTGCDGVYTFNPVTKALFGIKGQGDATQIVTSNDQGATWQAVASLPNISDVAVDPRTGSLWAANGALQVLEAASGGGWRKIANLPQDQWGEPRVRSVALDPTRPDVVYVATNRDIFNSFASALRSTNGGATWENLTRQTPLASGAKDGGRESFWVRVHPQTHEAWFVTGCYGIWKFAPPA